MNINILIKNGMIFDGTNFVKKDILIKNSTISKIADNIKGKDFFDASNLVISPGFIDLHTHLREPGFEHKETIKTGTAAAIAGGFTTVCAMPNLNPAPDNLNNLNIELEIIKKNALCNVKPFMAITKNRSGQEVINMEDVFEFCAGVSDDGNAVQNNEVMEKAMRRAAENNVLIAAHCEDEKKLSDESEFGQVIRDLNLVKKYRCRYHVCHVSCKKTIELIQDAKIRGLPVTCEITPHHALLCEDDIINENHGFIMKPPLRTQKDKKSLQKAIQDGTIDVFATDHAPHTPFEKLMKNVYGASGIECAFSVLYSNLVKTGIISLTYLFKMLTINPSKILKFDCRLSENMLANLIIIDLNKKQIIKGKEFISKGKSTPFEGMVSYGKVIKSFLNLE
ncbi:MAG: dihydroorotase [Oscillospiraceae bacterium]|jgi:dihydroorotase|nr:dihydroorotase [Oscillospiraceae bacterium]